jgi:hypothetical protein
MPSGERRPARAKQLIRQYQNVRRAFKKSLARHKAKLRQTFRHANAQGFRQAALDPLSELSDSSPLSTFSGLSGNSKSDGDYWDNILGPNWRGDSEDLFSDVDDPLAHPVPAGLDLDLEAVEVQSAIADIRTVKAGPKRTGPHCILCKRA